MLMIKVIDYTADTSTRSELGLTNQTPSHYHGSIARLWEILTSAL